MYNNARLCPGRLLGHLFVCIPASPYSGVGAGSPGTNRLESQLVSQEGR